MSLSLWSLIVICFPQIERVPPHDSFYASRRGDDDDDCNDYDDGYNDDDDDDYNEYDGGYNNNDDDDDDYNDIDDV